MLLKQAGERLVAQCAEGFLRLSFASSEKDIRKAMERLERAAQALT